MIFPSLAPRFIPLSLLTLLLLGCADEPGPPAARTARPTGPYFDVRGLVEQQATQLARRSAAVQKNVSLRTDPVERVRVPAVKWADELQVFLQADINKAALRGAYAVDSVQLAGGLVRHTFTRRADIHNAPVAQLTVVQAGGQPQELSAVITQSNPLFSTNKQLQMQFQDGRLQRYDVRGTQKLILFDTLRYTTSATVE